MIRWGVIGCGEATEKKSGPAFAQVEGSTIEAVMSRNAERARSYAERHGIKKWYTNVMDIIDGWQLDMPLVYDWECLAEDYRTMGVDARLLTDCTKAFCDTVKDAGYDPMIYYNPDQSYKQMYMDELGQYGLWLAKYAPYPDFPHPIHMWQYTNQGSVPGIQGNVDINLYFPLTEA